MWTSDLLHDLLVSLLGFGAIAIGAISLAELYVRRQQHESPAQWQDRCLKNLNERED